MPSIAKNPGKKTHGFDAEYRALCQRFPPRAITTKQQMGETQAAINSLIDKPTRLSRAEREYLNTLGTLVYEYEEKTVEIPAIHGVELLRELMKERGLRQKDLIAVFKTESIASAVLHGHRGLTRRHIEELARFFAVSPAAFLVDTGAAGIKVA